MGLPFGGPQELLRRLAMRGPAPVSARTPGINPNAQPQLWPGATNLPAMGPPPGGGIAPVDPRTPPTFPQQRQLPTGGPPPQPQGAPPQPAPTPGQQNLQRLLEQGPPQPQRASPLKQAAGYALGVLPFTSRTDLPERLMYKGDAPGERRQYGRELQNAQQVAAMEAGQRQAGLDERGMAAEELRSQAQADRELRLSGPEPAEPTEIIRGHEIQRGPSGEVTGTKQWPGLAPPPRAEQRPSMTQIMHDIATLEATPDRTPEEEQKMGVLKRTYDLEQQRLPTPPGPIAQARENRAVGAAGRKAKVGQAVTRWRALDADPRKVLEAFREAMTRPPGGPRALSAEDLDLAPEIEAELVDLAATQSRVEDRSKVFFEAFEKRFPGAAPQKPEAGASPTVPQTQRTPQQILENPQQGDRYVDKQGRQLSFDGTNWVVE